MDKLPDIQESLPDIIMPIRQVGVENIVVPFQLEFRKGGYCQLNANISMRTNLNDKIKGISMSRLLLTLKPFLALPLKHRLIKQILEDIKRNLGSDAAYMKFQFRMPLLRKSIISNNDFPLYYDCKFEGQLFPILDVQSNDDIDWPMKDVFRFYQGVTIQYASYCPCSAELCNNLKEKGSCGFPHNQRSYADIMIETIEPNYIWLEDIIETVEEKLKTLPYPVIKRVDEQEIAIISHTLDSRDDIHDWIVKCSHEESIHTSEAIAINYKGISGGLDEKRYL